MEDLTRALRDHPFASALSDEHVRFLAGCTKNVRFETGAYLFQEDQPATDLLLVRSGRVALETHIAGKGALALETLGAGDVIGWRALLAPERWHLDGRALDAVLVFAIDAACLREKLAAEPTFAVPVLTELLKIVHRRLERARLQQLDVYRSELA
jgi:CRP-like cAMP-binding protein